jgi:hypothetical protein
MEYAASLNLHVFTLLPNSSHIAQPCDKEVNAELKQTLNHVIVQPTSTGIRLQRESLARALAISVQSALKLDVVQKAFKSAGVLRGQSMNALSSLPMTVPVPD